MLGEYLLVIIIFWLVFGIFVIGCSEFVVMGLLFYFVEDFGIIENVVGYVISVYVIGVVVGVLFIIIFFFRFVRCIMFILMMVFYVGGNLLIVLVWLEWIMNIVCFIVGLFYGVYFGIVMFFVVDIVGKNKWV